MKASILLSLVMMSLACMPDKKQVVQQNLNEYFVQALPAEEPGGAVLVMRDDEVIYSGAFGIADVNTRKKITTNTLFNTGSISKTFVAHTILMLADEGRLSLDDPLIKFFPAVTNKALGDSVKIIHLLTHTSGLPDNRRLFHDSVFLLTAKDKENFAPVLKNDSLLFAPGSSYEYSNPAFNGLALIIEAVTGQKWQEVVAEKIFKPAGMIISTITDGSHPQQGVAHAYLLIGDQYVEKDYGEEPTFAAAGNGGVWSSVIELARYEQALQRALFSNAETIQRARTITLFENWKNDEPPFIGLSWFIGTTPDSITIVSHTGTQGGFYADYVALPDKKIIYVLLCNRPVPRDQFRKKVFSTLQQAQWLEE